LSKKEKKALEEDNGNNIKGEGEGELVKSGYVELEMIGGGEGNERDQVEIPKEGLVCG
jgi:hypothetical protein